ncbi:uncharacterized protein LOC129405940 [Sorex araneus]|uniref:uncharacterized protein LOC129405940 n=1 Tax=Sorex araneus TaxID=42254 RepID=UPI002433C55E|nr:uncharacterized protein LOC129405940 [Sorex araneus]
MLLLLLLLGLCCELPSAGALNEQKAGDSQLVNLISCMVSSPHPSGFKIVFASWYWKSHGSNFRGFKACCQELSSCLGSETYTSLKHLVTEDASLQLLVVQLQDTQYCYQMVNTSSNSQESILLEFLAAQANSTGKPHENIMVTCTPSCFSPQNTFSVNCTLKRKPSEKDNRTVCQCRDIKPSALLPCQAGNSAPTGPESVGLTIAMSVIGSVLAIVIAAFVIYWLRSRHRQRKPQQSVHSENYKYLSPTGSVVSCSDVPMPPTP